MDSKYKPGEGRRKKFAFDKGRQLDSISLEEVRKILPIHDIRRDHLIEYLHVLQDKFKFLYARHLRALADVMKLSMAEVYEVASFYAHFTILDDKDEKLPDITIRVCESLTCNLFESEKLYEDLSKKYKGKVRVLNAPCMGICDYAPALEVEHNHVDNATVDKVDKVITNKLFNPVISKFIDLDNYIKEGG